MLWRGLPLAWRLFSLLQLSPLLLFLLLLFLLLLLWLLLPLLLFILLIVPLLLLLLLFLRLLRWQLQRPLRPPLQDPAPRVGRRCALLRGPAAARAPTAGLISHSQQVYVQRSLPSNLANNVSSLAAASRLQYPFRTPLPPPPKTFFFSKAAWIFIHFLHMFPNLQASCKSMPNMV